MGISENDIVVGIVGMLHVNKGHKYFIEAASHVGNQNISDKRDNAYS